MRTTTEAASNKLRKINPPFPYNRLNKLCAWRHNMPPPPCKFTISSYLFARWHLCRHLCRHVGYLRRQQQVDLLTSKVVSESRVTWATSVPILVFLGLCSRVRPDVRDRQTSDKSID